MSADAFLSRVFSNLPPVGGRFAFAAWKNAGQPTSEGVGVLPQPGVDVEAMASRIMDLDRYAGNIDYVEESRIVPDPRWVLPQAARFYQRIRVPVLAEIQMELVLEDLGEREGWRLLAWHQLEPDTSKLDTKRGARSAYNVGAWLLRADAVGYALSSAPRKEDVGRLKFAALTKGADASAGKVVEANIQGMLRWSRR